jgi:hypothetical protein
MKKIILTFLSIITFSYFSFAQNTFPSSGSVGIGTTSPITLFDVKLATNQHVQFVQNVNSAYTGASGIVCINDANTAYTPLGFFASNYYFGNGRVGIGTTTPAATLDVNGTGNYSGNLNVSGGTIAATTYTGLSYPYNTAFGSGADASYTQLSAGSTNGLATGVYVYGGNATSANTISFNTASIERMRISSNGNVGIGTTNSQGYMLAVNGTAIATSMTVKAYANWPDYVFKKDYQLPSLTDVKTYIDQNHHLPEIPTEAQIAKDGLNLGDMDKLLVKKVEELTLYLIEKDKKEKEQEIINQKQQNQIDLLIKQVAELSKNKTK